MLEERGYNGYGFSLAFKWYETTDGYRERHPDNSGACNPDLIPRKEPVTNRKSEQADNVFYLFGIHNR